MPAVKAESGEGHWLTRIFDEWQKIKTYPISFSIAVLIGVFLAFGILKYCYGAALSIKNERIAALETELAKSNADSLYKGIERVGEGHGLRIDWPNKTARFEEVVTDGMLDKKGRFRFRDLVLSFKSAESVTRAVIDTSDKFIYKNAEFIILADRSRAD